MRKISLSIGAVLLSILLAVFVSCRMGQRPISHPEAPSADVVRAYSSQCVPTAGVPAKGVVGLSIVPPFSDRDYDLLSDLGVPWVRAEFYWSEIERRDGSYDWSATDRFVEETRRRGIAVLGVVNYIPPHLVQWTDIRARFEKFIPALVERYKPGGVLAREAGWDDGGISSWEIFNEPNLPGYGWLSRKHDPRAFVGEYTILLAVANKEVHAADPNAIIMPGGFSPDEISYNEFLAQMYAYGAARCFDVLAFHPYGKGGAFPQVAESLRRLMRRHGDQEKPIWFNEYGTADDATRGDVLRQAVSQREAADALFWFSLRDLKPRGWDFGLVEYDFKKKPEYEVFRSLLRQTRL